MSRETDSRPCTFPWQIICPWDPCGDHPRVKMACGAAVCRQHTHLHSAIVCEGACRGQLAEFLNEVIPRIEREKKTEKKEEKKEEKEDDDTVVVEDVTHEEA